ncbi:inositol-3-phosphate synthase [Bacillus cereus group sp. N12]|nr:inositol-3-phosphate synthase [Bacillus cereus group sp. N12]
MGYSHFDHKVRIHYFPVRGDRKEAWDTIDFEGWLGERMTMKINWLGY